MKPFHYRSSLLKMTIEYRMYLKFLQKPRCLGWFKTSQPLWSAVKKTNRVEFLERQFHSEKLSFVHKWNLSTHLTFLVPLVSFIGVFSILKCKTVVLKATTWGTGASHFVDGWYLLKMSNLPASSNPYVVGHLTLVGEGVMGVLVWARMSFPKPLELEFFSKTYNGVRYFAVMREISVQDIIFPRYILVSFRPRNQSIFFSEITHNLLKSQIIGR